MKAGADGNSRSARLWLRRSGPRVHLLQLKAVLRALLRGRVFSAGRGRLVQLKLCVVKLKGILGR